MLNFDRRTIDSTGAFLIGELEKLDPTINEPLQNTTWMDDIDLRDDVTIDDEFTSFALTNYSGGGLNGGKAFIRDNSNVIYGVGVDQKKVTSPIALWAMQPSWTILELRKSMRLNKPIDQSKIAGVQYKYQNDADDMVYEGDKDMGVAGLINHPGVTPLQMSLNFATASADQIVDFFNSLTSEALKKTANKFAPDRYLLPPALFKALARKSSEAGNKTIYTYLKENSLSTMTNNGRQPEILLRGRLAGKGVGGADRIVAYTRDKKYVRFSLAPMQNTPVEPDGLMQKVTYYCGMGCVEMPYGETVSYCDVGV